MDGRKIRMTPQLRSAWLDRAYGAYVDEWLWDVFGYAKGWPARFPEMILWYSTAGSGVLNEKAADKFVADARAGRPLPPLRRDTWRDAVRLAEEICEGSATNPVDWFTGGCGSLESGWRRLDEVHGIGPKIASFILRDLSFMRDYSKGTGVKAVAYRRSIDRKWFECLPPENQGLYIPVDVYVHAGARRHRASAICMKNAVKDIQGDPDLHRRAGSQIAQWARKKDCDPRDLDVYWYLLGAEEIHKNGTVVE